MPAGCEHDGGREAFFEEVDRWAAAIPLGNIASDPAIERLAHAMRYLHPVMKNRKFRHNFRAEVRLVAQPARAQRMARESHALQSTYEDMAFW